MWILISLDLQCFSKQINQGSARKGLKIDFYNAFQLFVKVKLILF